MPGQARSWNQIKNEQSSYLNEKKRTKFLQFVTFFIEIYLGHRIDMVGVEWTSWTNRRMTKTVYVCKVTKIWSIIRNSMAFHNEIHMHCAQSQFHEWNLDPMTRIGAFFSFLRIFAKWDALWHLCLQLSSTVRFESFWDKREKIMFY